jgi:hypothetical protein
MIIPLIALAACSANSANHNAASLPPLASGDGRILVTLKGDSLVMCEGGRPFALAAVAWKGDQASAPQDVPSVSWMSSDTTVATVDQKGEVTGRRAGRTYLVSFVRWGDVAAQKPFVIQVRRGIMDVAASQADGKLVCRT